MDYISYKQGRDEEIKKLAFEEHLQNMRERKEMHEKQMTLMEEKHKIELEQKKELHIMEVEFKKKMHNLLLEKASLEITKLNEK